MILDSASARRRRRPARVPHASILAACVVFTSFEQAPAQLPDCQPGPQLGASGFHVYLDAVSFARGSLMDDPELGALMEQLRFKLESNFEVATFDQPTPDRATGPRPELAFWSCQNRKPTSAAQFSESLIESLDRNDVILELWGQLDARNQGGVVTSRKAMIRYILVPVLKEDARRLRDAGSQDVEYTRDPATGKLVDLLEQSVELDAFVAVGVGVNLLRNDEYDEALQYLCKALIILEQPTGLKENRRAALVEYLKEKARGTVLEARKDTQYEGALKDLIDPDHPCPCTGGTS